MKQENYVESYRMITKEAQAEIVEKKSRFIASLAPVESEEEALAFIESVRKKYYDARHNCFAFIAGKDARLERCSDDGEPSGTAGRPMLEVLRGAGLTNVAAVVTRYFGGTLLGTGGLARAYTQAVQEAVSGCEIVTMRYGARYAVTAEYTLAGKLQYLFSKREIRIENTAYTDQVTFYVLVPSEMEGSFQKDLIELAAAKVRIEKLESAYYADRK
ncbi:MAG: YigZ family protein [Lachnospiraceae bacterium]|nr:YigZ family protein [Lachnospiraceae bacterium]